MEVSGELCIITTGGTFDKYYDEIRGELTFRESHLPRILKASRITIPVQVVPVQALDSLYMNDVHREQVAQTCAIRNEKRIIVTHGTDTMVETSIVIAKKKLNKVVVLTGAMVPYALENSDAVFNLGCAISAVQLLPIGVYICMCVKIFRYEERSKNRELGIFEGPFIPKPID